MRASSSDFFAALRILAEHKAEFVVIGGVGAVMRGAPITTFDLDIVHSRAADNLERLHAALVQLDASYREHTPKVLRPKLEDLALPGYHLLITRFGPLDVLGSVAKGASYADLASRSELFEIAPGVRVRVLALDALIELKEATNREKDRAVLPVLRRTLEEERRREQRGG